MLECEERGFPCTFGEVPIAVLERGAEVAKQVVAALGSGQDLEQVGRMTAEMDGVVEVMIGTSALRFRLDGGRPEWVYAESTFGTLAAPLAVPMAMNPSDVSPPVPDPLGDQRGKPTKRALVLSAFAWQWYLQSVSDETDEIAALFRGTRDYAGRTDVFKNTIILSGSSGGTPGVTQINQQVTTASFEGWDAYDVIHVSTHGSNVCQELTGSQATGYRLKPLNPCHTGLLTSELWTYEDPASATGVKFANQKGLYRTWLPATPQLASQTRGSLGTSAAAQDSNTGKWKIGPFVGVSTDWFKVEYTHGLKEAVVFLNACHSGENSDLVKHLSQQSSTVIGWDNAVGVVESALIAECFWRAALGQKYGAQPADACQDAIDLVLLENYGLNYAGGATIEDAFQVLQSMVGASNVNTPGALGGSVVIAVSGGVMRSGGQTAGGAVAGAVAGAQMFPTGDQRNRAIEIIRMMEPGTQQEFQDSGFVSLTGTAGDGVPDTLVAELEVFGIGPTDDPDGMTLYVDVAGNTQSKSLTLLPQTPSPDKRRTLPAIPLDMDLPPGGTLDLEVWVDYADGTSRWRYEGLEYDCVIPNLGTFQASITGGVGRTVLRGGNSQAGLRPWPQGGWVLNLRNRYDSDFELGVIIGGAPVAGQAYQVHDGNMQPPFYFSGGIDFDTPDKAGWFLGDATVRFSQVTPDGACGTLTADLIGMQSGAITPRRLQATITARFWAESRP